MIDPLTRRRLIPAVRHECGHLTFDDYVRKGILPPPKRRGTLARWKWPEIEAALDAGNLSVVQSQADEYERGVDRAKAAHG